MQKKGKVKFTSTDNNAFYQEVKKNVQHYFTDNHITRFANAGMVIKSIVLITFYLGTFSVILTVQPAWPIGLGLWIIMGISFAGIGMSVMHDANHGAYSASPAVNRLMGLSLNLLGGAVFNWKLQHNILHHTYTNIKGMDEDIDGKAGMRFTPHDKWEKKHRYQYIYVFFLYSLITLFWVTAKDFVQYVRFRRNGVNADTANRYAYGLLQLIVIKIFYFSLFLFLPILVFHLPVWYVLSGFVLMHFVGGIILSVVFQLAHTVEYTTYPLPDDEGNMENNWAVHQMHTTVNFSPGSKWISWYVGGLNFQLEHHLFPRICHVHYPKIAPIVRKTAAQFGIPYLENKTFLLALRSHIQVLKHLGKDHHVSWDL
ncbi:MAG: acyl-CoA desaturase [Chitinophagales bacterium]